MQGPICLFTCISPLFQLRFVKARSLCKSPSILMKLILYIPEPMTRPTKSLQSVPGVTSCSLPHIPFLTKCQPSRERDASYPYLFLEKGQSSFRLMDTLLWESDQKYKLSWMLCVHTMTSTSRPMSWPLSFTLCGKLLRAALSVGPSSYHWSGRDFRGRPTLDYIYRLLPSTEWPWTIYS
jgi:hypothetical protein